MNTRARSTTTRPPMMAVVGLSLDPTLLTVKGFGRTSTGVEAFYD